MPEPDETTSATTGSKQTGEASDPPETAPVANAREQLLDFGAKYKGPITGVAILLVEVLIHEADIRRPIFFLASVVAVLLLLALAIWHIANRDLTGSLVGLGGALLVVLLATLGAPSESSGSSREGAAAIASPRATPSGIVVEEPSEAEAIFSRQIQAVTPWVNDVERLYTGFTTDDIPGEAVLAATWWALSDWCYSAGDGSVGRCYDLGAEYVQQKFGRDPRVINTQLWYAGGAIGDVLDRAYAITAEYVGVDPHPGVGVEDDRPGIAWTCEPSCTAGYSLTHSSG
jgi:hypothetical protein